MAIFGRGVRRRFDSPLRYFPTIHVDDAGRVTRDDPFAPARPQGPPPPISPQISTDAVQAPGRGPERPGRAT